MGGLSPTAEKLYEDVQWTLQEMRVQNAGFFAGDLDGHIQDLHAWLNKGPLTWTTTDLEDIQRDVDFCYDLMYAW